MRPSFLPRFVNNPFSDPALFIPFLFEKRALMFDLGDIHALTPRDLLKVSHVFVTHTHMDHFIGFDQLIRILLGREKELHIYGPQGILSHVKGKLAGYTWNLVDGYQYNLSLKVSEVLPDKILTKRYLCREQFDYRTKVEEKAFSGILHEETAFSVRAILLDHRIPCLGLGLVENFYVNIINEGLRELGLTVGPWINRFKKALYEQRDPESEFIVTKEKGGAIINERRYRLGDLTRKIAKISPGRKISYVTDIIGSEKNFQKVIELVKDSDQLFIEAAFLECDRDIAERKYHLTAKDAGDLSRKACVKEFTLFHFSPRYSDRAADMEAEARSAFNSKLESPR